MEDFKLSDLNFIFRNKMQNGIRKLYDPITIYILTYLHSVIWEFILLTIRKVKDIITDAKVPPIVLSKPYITTTQVTECRMSNPKISKFNV